MAVVFKKLGTPGWRWRESRQTVEWADAYAHALVDDFTVTASPGRGWSCSCDDLACTHPDAVAALIHPHILALLEGERIIPTRRNNHDHHH